MNQRTPALLLALFAVGCGPSAEEQAAAASEALREARADSVIEAQALYEPAAFDSIGWAVPDSALARGAVVWRYSCIRCHGVNGAGGGELAVQHQLNMPNLRSADWQLAGDVPAIRHRVFVGHESEMPNWGLHGLTYRDIDAVTRYITEELN